MCSKSSVTRKTKSGDARHGSCRPHDSGKHGRTCEEVLNTPGENGRKNHLIRLTFVGSSTTEPVLSRACSKFDLDFNILLGQVDEIQSESYGTLTIVMEGTTENFRQD